jgi:hypothetical protein
MRALIVGLTLLVSVAFCVAFLVFVMGIRFDTPVLVSLAFTLFMLAALFAAISALGPKFRPTPMLTPTMAGTIAVVLTTLLVAVGHAELPARQQVAAPSVAPPAVAEMTPQEMPEIAAAPKVRSVDPPAMASPALPADMLNPPTVEQYRPLADLVEPVSPSEPRMAMPALSPTPNDAPASTDVAAVDPSPTAAAEAALKNLPPATAEPAVPQPETPLSFAQDSFDSSGANSGASSGVSASPNVAAAITPPLPRSRPCGADGPPCP